VHVLSIGSWQTLAAPASAPAVPVETQRSPVGQSDETTHAVWHLEKTQTSGELQSLLSEHPGAVATGDELLQPVTTIGTEADTEIARVRQTLPQSE
jgi:hypothetical protein